MVKVIVGPGTCLTFLNSYYISCVLSVIYNFLTKVQKRPDIRSRKRTSKWWKKAVMEFIGTGKTPGKKESERCISTSPVALAERGWRAETFCLK